MRLQTFDNLEMHLNVHCRQTCWFKLRGTSKIAVNSMQESNAIAAHKVIDAHIRSRSLLCFNLIHSE